MIAVGVITQLLARVLAGSLDATTLETLAATYQTRFFLRVAFSESAATVGFVGFVLTANPWVYLVGAAFAALGFAWLVPSSGHVARDEQVLRALGRGVSLLDALTATPDAGLSPGGRA